MANRPHKETVIASFTLPKFLLDLVEQKAGEKMTNKSDIIRQAIMNYLSPTEREWVVREIREKYGKEKKP
jgi:metal-responsive CopG/Arc/MetJ family transcriptional regulator